MTDPRLDNALRELGVPEFVNRAAETTLARSIAAVPSPATKQEAQRGFHGSPLSTRPKASPRTAGSLSRRLAQTRPTPNSAMRLLAGIRWPVCRIAFNAERSPCRPKHSK